MKTILTSFLLSLCFLVSAPAMAMDLQQAKNDGLVGEANTGYLAVPENGAASSEIRRLIAEVNKKREASYSQIASRNKIKTADVALMAYKKAVERTRRGNFYQRPDGRWVKK